MYVAQKDWNQNANSGASEFRSSYGPNYKERNAYLRELMHNIDSKIMNYIKLHGEIDGDIIEAFVSGDEKALRTDNGIDFIEFAKQRFIDRYNSGKIGVSSRECSQNAIQIQIWVCLMAWLLMQVVKSQTTRKWSLSNMMVAVRILLNSYIGLYDFLNAPEAQWMKIIRARQQEQTQGIQLSLFERGPVFENKKTLAYLSAMSDYD